MDSYQLTVIAEDDGSCCVGGGDRHSATQYIKINIVDSKNFKPQFTECSSYYNASILEEEPIGTYVLTVRYVKIVTCTLHVYAKWQLNDIFCNIYEGICNRQKQRRKRCRGL